MISVLIADDETILCNGIKNCIDWEALGAEVVATAGNGTEALEKIRRLSPDICLLDVRMPFLDGLSVAERYLKEKPDGVAIIISGYDEFSYAQTAVNTGVFAYILKPVDENELLATIQKAVAKISEDREASERQSQNQRLLESNREVLLDTLLQKMLLGQADFPALQFELSAHSVEIAPQSAMLLICRPDETGVIPGNSGDWLVHAKKLAETAFSGFTPSFLTAVGANVLVCVYERDRENLWLDLPAAISAGLEGAELSGIVVQQELSSPEEIPDVYARLLAEAQKTSCFSPIIMALKQYAGQNFRNQQISLQEFAGSYNTSSSYLSRQFKQETGVPFMMYLTQLRIYNSLHYLRNPSAKIREIAELCGYGSQHYYCESFRRIMNMSPSEYRKTLPENIWK